MRSFQDTFETCKRSFISAFAICMTVPLSDKGDHLTRSLIRKLNRCFNKNVKFMKRYKTNKLAMFCSSKDYVQFQKKANVVLFIKLHVLVVSKNA